MQAHMWAIQRVVLIYLVCTQLVLLMNMEREWKGDSER